MSSQSAVPAVRLSFRVEATGARQALDRAMAQIEKAAAAEEREGLRLNRAANLGRNARHLGLSAPPSVVELHQEEASKVRIAYATAYHSVDRRARLEGRLPRPRTVTTAHLVEVLWSDHVLDELGFIARNKSESRWDYDRSHWLADALRDARDSGLTAQQLVRVAMRLRKEAARA